MFTSVNLCTDQIPQPVQLVLLKPNCSVMPRGPAGGFVVI
jgi:hypothetical protein